MKFTPGPWKVHNQAVWNPNIKCGNIAHIYCKETNKNSDFKTDEMAKANAALIAESPAMYSVLRALLDDIKSGSTITLDSAQGKALVAVLERIEGGE